ncbi:MULTISPECIES: RNA polymerase sigma factor [Pseudomonas]|jgi:RNA polymerase sigma factor (sigma-70 family)|uniref:RNA polymerase sigma factor, sigma-70 family n=1 Tax=Pseudomonas indica TaxID=137658 RepID=A0A1G9AC15_9PSED|nr:MULTISPECIES: RNA polymerase sigma factor [Pseudomonas]MBU3056161.1 RNA polymerase sigma factor [Pseudomonas indica]PAU65220.1 RNA polymerase subunit sigma [Pseudomonas indica]PAU66305.1 RNA polymerase subunit sigma [Pseudomonas sp. PIC25]SDK24927.1 RNA polymerase sigma factor, sigma-70 family [Pseudomonas indica]
MENIAIQRPELTQVDWGELAKSCEQKLRRFIRKRVLNQDDAEDLMQMTYLEALRNQHKFSGTSKPETWLFGIAVNLVRNHFKCLYGQPQCSDLDDVIGTLEYDMDPGALAEQHHTLARTAEAIEALPSDMRTLLDLIVESDLSYQDAAEALGIPVGTVRSRLSRAREQLKNTVFS